MIQVDTNLWRGPRPTDLQPLQDQVFVRIISLESGVYDLFHADRVEQQFPCEYGMAQYDLKCSDISPPSDWVVLKFLALMKFGLKTFLHCLSGVDRTGFLCAVYRMRVQGWTYEAALAEWKKLGRHPWYFFWEPALKRWAPGGDAKS